MNWLLSIVIAFLTGACGVGLGLLVGTLNVRWYRISSFEGNSGYYTLGIGLLGGLIGLVTGLVAARLVVDGAQPWFLKGLGSAVGSFVGLSVVVTVLCWLGAGAPTPILFDPPAPGPKLTQAQQDALVAAERLAELDAVPADAPIAELFKFTELNRSETLRAAALKRLQARPQFAAELVATIESADIRDVSAALRVVGQLDAFPPELHGAVASGGRRLAAWKAAWSAAQVSPDVAAPDEYAIGACSRNWLEAVRVLRLRAGGDFAAEFAAFLRDSREMDRPALRELGGFPAPAGDAPGK